jgi:hypothetical protein
VSCPRWWTGSSQGAWWAPARRYKGPIDQKRLLRVMAGGKGWMRAHISFAFPGMGQPPVMLLFYG